MARMPTPLERGISAYFTGFLRSLNPYEEGSESSRLWYTGWDEAEERTQYRETARLIFPETPGICSKCGDDQYTVLELNLDIDQVDTCYSCHNAAKY